MEEFFRQTQKRFAALVALLGLALLLPATALGSGAPQIVVPPQSQITFAGSNATLLVSATGDGLNYQWYWNPTDETITIPGATNAALTLTNLQASQYGDYSVIVSNPVGSVTNDAMLTVLTALTGPVNPYAPGTLGYDLFESTFSLASAPDKTASYNPAIPNLGTNAAVWTWPVNLSCVGYASDNFQSVLITPDKLLTCAHLGGESGQSVTFYDTNGVPWVGVVTNVINVIADLDIAELSNAAPATIVIPYVLPPGFENYIAGHTLLGMPAFWAHRNTGHIDYAPVAEVADANWYGYGTWVQLYNNSYGYGGTPATGGDSGSPAFLSWSNQPVLLFATSLTPDSVGLNPGSSINWAALAALGLTNGMNILNVSGYPLQSASPPAVDYNYLVSPSNQVAGVGALVTFGVGIYVFEAPPFTYHWQWNGTNLADATNATLTIPASANNAGTFSVIASNTIGSVTSSATLTVTSAVPVQILAPAVTNGQFQFGFNTLSNYSYTVEYADSLTTDDWIALTNFTATGSHWEAPRLPLVTQRYYRVSSP